MPEYTGTCARCGDTFTATAHNRALYCSPNCRKRAHDDAHRASCVDCGTALTARSGYANKAKATPLRCKPCYAKYEADQKEALAARYEALWAAGKTLQAIAEEMGLKDRFSAGAIVSMYRAEGRNFPYRRTGQALENLRANTWGRGKVAA